MNSNRPTPSVRQQIARDEIDALGLGVHTIDEEARHAGAERRDQRRHLRGVEVFREHDAVVDVDAIRIDGRLEIAEAKHRAERIVDRLLGVERLRAERDGDVARSPGRCRLRTARRR